MRRSLTAPVLTALHLSLDAYVSRNPNDDEVPVLAPDRVTRKKETDLVVSGATAAPKEGHHRFEAQSPRVRETVGRTFDHTLIARSLRGAPRRQSLDPYHFPASHGNEVDPLPSVRKETGGEVDGEMGNPRSARGIAQIPRVQSKFRLPPDGRLQRMSGTRPPAVIQCHPCVHPAFHGVPLCVAIVKTLDSASS